MVIVPARGSPRRSSTSKRSARLEAALEAKVKAGLKSPDIVDADPEARTIREGRLTDVHRGIGLCSRSARYPRPGSLRKAPSPGRSRFERSQARGRRPLRRRPRAPRAAAGRSGRRAAPSASAFTTSEPRRTPPSTSTGMRPATALDDRRQRLDRRRRRRRADGRRGWRRSRHRRRATAPRAPPAD